METLSRLVRPQHSLLFVAHYNLRLYTPVAGKFPQMKGGGREHTCENSSEVAVALTMVHEDIDGCRRCEPDVRGFRKPPHLDRGEPGKLLIVGQGPGNARLRGKKAFAGQSGRTLDSWLRAAGLSDHEPRKGFYLTSVIKCCHSSPADFGLMARNCSGFLQRQIMAIKPQVVITLGKDA